MESPLRLIKRSAEFRPIESVKRIPRGRRGLYVLYRLNTDSDKKRYDVVYVGMATKGVRGRLESHVKSRTKEGKWTHFSVFEVWDNIRDEEIAELEGLFRHLYRLDTRANELNIQRGFKKAASVRQNDFQKWT